MKFSAATAAAASLVLASLASAGGIPSRHRHLHSKKDAEPSPEAMMIEKRSPASDAVSAKLSSMGFAGAGVNAAGPGSSTIFFGDAGPYTMEMVNKASEELVAVCWGPSSSWVNAKQPLMTFPLAPGASRTISFATGASGACSAIYGDTGLVNGQVSQTWMEFTMGNFGVVDVSREVNMDGHPIKVEGPTCTTDMETCVFVCPGGQKSCMTGYELQNCDPTQQKGAQYGTYFGAPSGGCGGMGSSAHFTTTFS